MSGFVLRRQMQLDNSQYMAAMDATTTKTQASMRVMGQSIQRQTEGWRRLSGSITSTVGSVTSFLGVAGLVVGTVTAAGLAAHRLATASQRAREEAEKELEARRASLGAITAARSELTRTAGFAPDSPAQVGQRATASQRADILAAIAETEAQADPLRRRLTRRFDQALAAERLFAGDTGRTTEAEQIAAALITTQQKLPDVTARFNAIQDVVSGLRSELAELDRLSGRIAGREATRMDLSRRREISTAGSMLALAQGQQEEAQRLDERQRHAERMAALDEAAERGEEGVEKLRELERELHETRMNNIDRESKARRDADDERAKRERQAAARAVVVSHRSTADLAMGMMLRRAELMGDDEQAERLRIQMGHRSRIRSIIDLGLRPSQQRRALKEANDLYRMEMRRVGQAESGMDATRAPDRSRSIGSGVRVDSFLAGQVFTGANDAVSVARDTARSANGIEAIRELLNELIRSGRSAIAVLG